MRFLHTSDWHLGRTFHGVSLVEDQALVLDRLVEVVAGAGLDAVLLAGDVYDRATPPADAVRLLDETLTRIVTGLGVPVVMIAGNHDSGDRLGFASRLLGSGGLHVAGTEPLVVPFDDAHGRLEVVAVPFAEPAMVAARRGDETLADAAAALGAELAGGSAARRVAVAHAFVSGGASSESERPLVLGTAALVPSSCFDGFAYAALGHLHRPQAVGRAAVRYSGSLLKYSFDEVSHAKGVSIVEIGPTGSCTVEEVGLAPRRDVRVLEGTLDELRRAAASGAGREDYVMARLLDRGAVLDAMGKLRDLYPNCLHVVHAGMLAERDEAPGSRSGLRELDEAELFDAFYREVTGLDAAGEERAAFAEALAAARRAQAEA